MGGAEEVGSGEAKEEQALIDELWKSAEVPTVNQQLVARGRDLIDNSDLVQTLEERYDSLKIKYDSLKSEHKELKESLEEMAEGCSRANADKRKAEDKIKKLKEELDFYE